MWVSLWLLSGQVIYLKTIMENLIKFKRKTFALPSVHLFHHQFTSIFPLLSHVFSGDPLMLLVWFQQILFFVPISVICLIYAHHCFSVSVSLFLLCYVLHFTAHKLTLHESGLIVPFCFSINFHQLCFFPLLIPYTSWLLPLYYAL